jgi:hypothetical protein
MNDLAEDLRRWVDSVAPVSPAEAIDRAGAGRHRRPRRAATGLAAVALVAAGFVVVVAIAAVTAGRTEGPTLRTGAPAGPGGLGATVSVAVDGLGPLAVTTGPLHAPDPGSTAWAQHELRFENTGTTPVVLDDTRLSAFPHGQPLVLAEDGCDVMVCTAERLDHMIGPGESFTFPVRVWRDQPGMPALVPGTYTFSKTLTWVPGSDTEPIATGTITLTYAIDAPVPETVAPAAETTMPETTVPATDTTLPGTATTAPGTDTTAPGTGTTAPGPDATVPGTATTVLGTPSSSTPGGGP